MVTVAVATRDNSESRTCIGGRLDISTGWSSMFGGLREDGDSRRWVAGRPMSGRWGDGVGWFVGLGDCRGLRVALSWSGGSLVGGGGGCVSVGPGVGPAAGAVVSSSIWWDSNPQPLGERRGVGFGWSVGPGERRVRSWIGGSSVNNSGGWVGISYEGSGVGR